MLLCGRCYVHIRFLGNKISGLHCYTHHIVLERLLNLKTGRTKRDMHCSATLTRIYVTLIQLLIDYRLHYHDIDVTY